MNTLKSFKLLALVVGLLAFSSLGFAATCDLTTTTPGNYCGDSAAPAGINGALFQEVDDQATGTGVIDPFVQISGSGNLDETAAYNTTVNNVLQNTSADNWNHQIMLSDVEQVDVDGTLYYKFVLDINESDTNAGDSLLSLDEVQVFLSDTPNQSTTTFSGGVIQLGDLVYQLDGGGDNVVLLDYNINSGSGSGDMNMLIPVSAFAGHTGQYVYLYSHFGGEGGVYGTSDGFEEWDIIVGPNNPQIPEPATLILLGTGLLGVAGKVRRRMKKS